jgi:hypothetical protein
MWIEVMISQGEYGHIAQMITYGWEMGIDDLNDVDLKYHAVGSGREETASTTDLYEAYPKQATGGRSSPSRRRPRGLTFKLMSEQIL